MDSTAGQYNLRSLGQQPSLQSSHATPGLNRMAAEDGRNDPLQHAIHKPLGSTMAQNSLRGAASGPSNLAKVLGTGKNIQTTHGVNLPTVLGTHGSLGSSLPTKRLSRLDSTSRVPSHA